MADAGEVRYRASVDDSQVDGDMNKVGSKITAKAVAIGTLTADALKAVGSAFVNFAKQAVAEGSDLEQSIGGIETLFGAGGKSAEEYAKSVGKSVEESKADYEQLMKAQTLALENADKAYKTAGLSANDYMQTISGFAASLKQSVENETEAAKIADMAVIDMADNANKMGTDMASIQTAYQGFAKQNYTMLDNLKLGYGGTKQEMQRLLEDAEKLTGVHYDIDNLADVYSAIHAIQGELGITGTTAKEASETVSGSFATMESAFHNLLGAMATNGDVETAIQNLVDSVGVYLGNLIPMAKNVMDNVFKSVGGLIQQHGPDMITKGVEIITNMVSGMANSAPQVITTITQLLVSLLGAITQNLPQLVQSGIQLVGSLAQGLLQNAPAILSAIGQLIMSLLSEIINHLPEILEKGSEIVGKLAEGVLNAVPKILEAIGQLLTKAKDAFLQTDWKSIGTNIIDGVVEGLKNAGSNLFSAMREMAGNALRAAKEKLKINSPSKVFRDEVGESIPEGMAAGIRKNSDMVTDAVDDMTGGLTDRVQDLTANIGQDFSYHGSTSIEVPVNLDGREIARGTAVYTDQQLAWESR